MKRFLVGLCASVACLALLASCLSSGDDDIVSYSDTAITQFTLGSLNRYTSTTSSKTGNDTIIKSTVTGSTYKMTIDHSARTIYNTTELPVGTDVKHVLCTITTKNVGVVALKSISNDSLYLYSSKDSVDFSNPRVFRVYSSDGTAYRDYTVSLNVSSTTGVNFGWELVKTDPLLAGWDKGKRLEAVGDTVRLADTDSIVGATDHEAYMLARDGKIKVTRDAGLTWLDDNTDDADSLLPTQGTAAIVSWQYAPADNTDYVLMVGTPRQSGERYMRVWRKIAPWDGGGQWVFMPRDDSNYYPLPLLEDFQMAYYDGKVLVMGSDHVVRQSRDQGISWRTASTYSLPEALTGTNVLMTNDRNGWLWLLTDSGQLWRGGTVR